MLAISLRVYHTSTMQIREGVGNLWKRKYRGKALCSFKIILLRKFEIVSNKFPFTKKKKKEFRKFTQKPLTTGSIVGFYRPPVIPCQGWKIQKKIKSLKVLKSTGI